MAPVAMRTVVGRPRRVRSSFEAVAPDVLQARQIWRSTAASEDLWDATLEGEAAHFAGAHPCCFQEPKIDGIALTDRKALS